MPVIPEGPQGTDASKPGLRDAFGRLVPDTQPTYEVVQYHLGTTSGGIFAPNPNYKPNKGNPVAAAPVPPHLQFTFDTIGQVIARSLGHCRLPLKLLWVQGIDASGEWLDGCATTFDAPITSTVLQFGQNDDLGLAGQTVPNWVTVGVSVTGSFAIPPGTTVGGVSGSAVSLTFTPPYTGLIADIPPSVVIFFFSSGKASTNVDAAQGTTILTFDPDTLPGFVTGAIAGVPKLSGVIASGDFLPPGATVVSATDTTVGISAGLLALVPAGTEITFSKGPTTVTLAAALCAPIDPNEEGGIAAFYSGSDLLFTPGSGVSPPPGWSESDQQQLIDSMGAITYYPGTESQFPDPTISSDKGTAVTNAFRGLRYLVIPRFPITGGFTSLSVVFHRSNGIASGFTAVEFAAGAG